MRARAALVGVALLGVALSAHGSARSPSEQRLLDASEFRPITVHRGSTSSPAPSLALQSLASPALPTLPAPSPELTLSPVKQPEVRARVKLKVAQAKEVGNSARGVPTWYCNKTHPEVTQSVCTRGYPDVTDSQMYAAAGPSLQVGDWRGRTVTVTAPSGKSVQVKLVDSCACGGSHFIDLYYDAFKLLGSPSTAVVTW